MLPAERLRKLNIGFNPGLLRNETGLVALLELLGKAPHLEELDLSATGLTRQGLICLAKTMPNCDYLYRLDLGLNPGVLGEDTGLAGLIAILRKAPNLEELSANCTALTARHLHKLGTGLGRNEQLRKLCVGGNPGLFADDNGENQGYLWPPKRVKDDASITALLELIGRATCLVELNIENMKLTAQSFPRFVSFMGPSFNNRKITMGLQNNVGLDQKREDANSFTDLFRRLKNEEEDKDGGEGRIVPKRDLKLKRVRFQAGRVGFQLHLDSGTVTAVHDGGQAQKAGVQVGWSVRNIDGQSYSESLFSYKMQRGEPYKVDFDVPLASCLEELDIGGTGVTPKLLAQLQGEIVGPANFCREINIRDNARLLADEAGLSALEALLIKVPNLKFLNASLTELSDKAKARVRLLVPSGKLELDV